MTNHRLSAVLLGGVFLVSIWACAAFGAVHAWAWTLVSGAMLGLFLLAALVAGLPTVFRAKAALVLPQSSPLTLPILLFVAWGLLQILALPPGLLKHLSPQAFAVWDLAVGLTGKPDIGFSLSLAPWQSGQVLLRLLGPVAAYFLVLWLADTRSRQRRLVAGLVLAGTAIAGYGLWQYFSGSMAIWGWRNPYMGRPFGTFVNVDHFAFLLVLVILLAMGLLQSRLPLRIDASELGRPWLLRAVDALNSLKSQAWLLGCLGMLFGALMLTSSRGGMLGLLAGLVTLLWLTAKRRRHSLVPLLWLLLPAAAAVVAALTGGGLGRYDVDSLSHSVVARAGYLRESLPLFRDYWPLGAGLGSFAPLFKGVQAGTDYLAVEYMHNDWVEVLLETGVPGLLLALGGVALLMRRMLRTLGREREDIVFGLGAGLLAALVAGAAMSCFHFALRIPGLLLTIALVGGLAIMATTPINPKGPQPQQPPGPLGRILVAVGLVLLSVAVLAAERRLFDRYQAEAALPLEKDSTRGSAVLLDLWHVETALAHMPDSPVACTLRGSYYLRLPVLAAALRQQNLAKALDSVRAGLAALPVDALLWMLHGQILRDLAVLEEPANPATRLRADLSMLLAGKLQTKTVLVHEQAARYWLERANDRDTGSPDLPEALKDNPLGAGLLAALPRNAGQRLDLALISWAKTLDLAPDKLTEAAESLWLAAGDPALILRALPERRPDLAGVARDWVRQRTAP